MARGAHVRGIAQKFAFQRGNRSPVIAGNADIKETQARRARLGTRQGAAHVVPPAESMGTGVVPKNSTRAAVNRLAARMPEMTLVAEAAFRQVVQLADGVRARITAA